MYFLRNVTFQGCICVSSAVLMVAVWVIEASILSKLLREREVASANLFLCFSYWENWKSPRQLWSWKRFIEEEAKKSSSYTILVVPKKTQLNFWIVCHFCIGGNGVVYGIVYGTCFLSVRDMENHRNDRTTFQMVIANVFTSVCQAYGCNELLNKE